MALGLDLSAFQGTLHVIVRTPLGVWIVDPLATPDPTVQAIKQALGIDIEVRAGDVPAEDLAAPSLGSNLGLLAIGGALLALHHFSSRGRR